MTHIHPAVFVQELSYPWISYAIILILKVGRRLSACLIGRLDYQVGIELSFNDVLNKVIIHTVNVTIKQCNAEPWCLTSSHALAGTFYLILGFVNKANVGHDDLVPPPPPRLNSVHWGL